MLNLASVILPAIIIIIKFPSIDNFFLKDRAKRISFDDLAE